MTGAWAPNRGASRTLERQAASWSVWRLSDRPSDGIMVLAPQKTSWVCLKMLCTPKKTNGFADHYPYINPTFSDKPIFLGKFHHDLTAVRDRTLEIMVNNSGESSPFMAELFRLVIFYDLPRYLQNMCIYIYIL